ncbi:GNAT family N-acetyltransferase [Streptosporangium sp. NPDC000396]|uniref:GNAT family N-acetyltransferase n=1 Tax=Streptosporangium sp. NPDC000396 TaxID=3366185 RepID=UPI0036ABFC65
MSTLGVTNADRPEPRVVDNPRASRFEIVVDGETAGFAVYKPAGTKLAFTHTEIDPRFEGRGLGSILARGALDAARAAGKPVLPFCPFIRGYIQRHPDYLDLVPPDQRARFGFPADELERHSGERDQPPAS